MSDYDHPDEPENAPGAPPAPPWRTASDGAHTRIPDPLDLAEADSLAHRGVLSIEYMVALVAELRIRRAEPGWRIADRAEQELAEVTAERDRWVTSGIDSGQRIIDLRAERDAAHAELAQRDQTIARVRALVDSAPTFPVHVGGGNLVDRRRLVNAGELRRVLDGEAS